MRVEAKRYLEEYKKIDAMILNKTIEAEQWEALAQSITANMGGEKVQSSSNQQKMQDYICNKIDIESEIDVLIAKKKDITDTIALLPMADYIILHKEYIQHKPLKTIAIEEGKDYKSLTTTKGRAIQNLQKILDKRG
jgi:hypothetical protein